MEHFIAWCGFVGGWLLFAGPIYQAAVELREEEFSRESFEAVAQRVPRPKGHSPFWWFLPPVAYYLQHRDKAAYRDALFAELSGLERDQLISFFEKAHGWMIVAAGAFLIAVKETWELHEVYEWHGWVFWALVVAAAWLGLTNTVVRMRRGEPEERRRRGGPVGRQRGPRAPDAPAA